MKEISASRLGTFAAIFHIFIILRLLFAIFVLPLVSSVLRAARAIPTGWQRLRRGAEAFGDITLFMQLRRLIGALDRSHTNCAIFNSGAAGWLTSDGPGELMDLRSKHYLRRPGR